MTTTTTSAVPAKVARALALGAGSIERFTGTELRVLLLVAASDTPPTAYGLARALSLRYTFAKEIVRGLRACRVLTLTAGHGLVLQPDTGRWTIPGPRPRTRKR
jgi:hypothetical protein